MIGRPITGSSFLGCISYNLEDKRELSEEQKEQLSQLEGVQHKDRAEVLVYNKCFGDKYELAAQFREVAQLSKRVEKPVFHFPIRLAPGDTINRDELIEIGEACVKEFEVENNQYLIILHKDTREPHIHIIANRVGFDGKVASDSYSKRRMMTLCRKLEKQYKLREVLGPRASLPKELRLIPQHNTRKERLKNDIRRTLEQVKNYQEFAELMQKLGYTVLKSRGIAFIDDKKVRIKGSEVGFPLSKIEQILHLKKTLVDKQAKQTFLEAAQRQQTPKYRASTPAQKLLLQTWQQAHQEKSPLFRLQQEMKTIAQELNQLLYGLLKPEYTDQSINPELLKEAKRKKKRRPPR